MSLFNSSILKYTKAEENVLRARLDAIRAAIPPQHRADKGRSVEIAIHRFLREILPNEYGITTGFIAYHSSNCIKENIVTTLDEKSIHYNYDPREDSIEVSSQLDIIIYDALRFTPLARLEGCDVLPFEAVFAYIEIKSWIDNRTNQKTGLTILQEILKQSASIRQIKTRLYWLSVPGKYTKTLLFP